MRYQVDKAPSRDREVVHDWLLEKIDDYYIDGYCEDKEDRIIQISVVHSLIRKVMLTKTQAKWVDNVLNTYLERDISRFVPGSGNAITTIDDWSIYADAWYMYCRPGAYVLDK